MDSESIKSVHILEEIMEEILSRLPVKSLLRFRCVSKSWLSLISSERFIEVHRQISTKNTAFPQHKVMFEFGSGVFKQCSVQQLLNATSSIEPSPIHRPTNNIGIVIGCCNGLICLCKNDNTLSLWNPATRISIELPKLKDLGYAKFGFGWDGRSGAYKVFALFLNKGNVYSSKTNSWKTVEAGCLSLYDVKGVFACGKIHWIIKISKDYYIESFDLESEEFGRIGLPFKTLPKLLPPPRYALAEIGGCLHLVRVHVHRQQLNAVFWVMKEECGWLKLLSFPPHVFKHRKLPLSPLFGGGPNGEILLKLHENFLFYNGKDSIVLQASGNIKHLNKGRVYVETLVSPNFAIAS